MRDELLLAGGECAARRRTSPLVWWGLVGRRWVAVVEGTSLGETEKARDLSGAVIIESVHCRQCGYNLRGLSPTGRCPECGLDVWETILHTVDPAASRLPKLRNPKAVGDGLLWLMICALASAVLLVIGPAGRDMHWWGPNRLIVLGLDIPGDLPLVAGIVALAGLWGPWKLMPPSGQELRGPVRRDVWLVACGFLAFGGLAVGLWALQEFWPSAVRPIIIGRDIELARRAMAHLLMTAAAITGLLGLRGVFLTIGLRSRAYRNARGGQQRVNNMIVAAVVVAAGLILRWAGLAHQPEGSLVTLGTIVLRVSMLMILIGLAYLVVNANWIRSSLLRPPPKLDEIIQRAGSAGSPQPR